MTIDAAPPLLEMNGIAKRFPGVVALRGVSLILRAGEVLALCGENGAGKSTLMKVLGGIVAPDEGEVKLSGETVVLRGVADARQRGIALIHQELLMVPQLDIAGNIFLGAEPTKFRFGPIDRGGMHRRAAALLERVGLSLPADTPVHQLTPGQQQLVEIAKALALKARVLIMDEPTSSLTLSESRRLFEIIDGLRRDGMGVVYISHRMEEIFRVADRITVLRDGGNVGDLDPRTATTDMIVSRMVGRERSQWFPHRSATAASVSLLKVEDLIVPGAKSGVTFDARPGEILGFAGLVGSGRTELMQVLFGVDVPLGGRMTLAGKPYAPTRPMDAVRAGVFLAPEDRKIHGLILPASIEENIALPATADRFGLRRLRRSVERPIAAETIRRLTVRATSGQQKAVTLSGGNQQKVVLGKWLALKPRVLILDEPTRGIDVGAKVEIYQHIIALADQGVTVMLVSSEMEEILGLSDRVVVLHERRLAGVVEKADLSEERLMALMAGAAK